MRGGKLRGEEFKGKELESEAQLTSRISATDASDSAHTNTQLCALNVKLEEGLEVERSKR